MAVLAVVGLKREQAIVAAPDIRVVAGGGASIRLAAAIEAMIAERRPLGVISIGVAGALDPTLAAGDCVVARTVVGAEVRYETDPAWSAAIIQALGDARSGDIYGSDRIVMTAAAKRDLFEATGALAVDMESHVAAKVAAAHGLPFAGVRVVSDTAGRDLPPAFQVGMEPDGGVAYGAIFCSILAQPWQLPTLMRSARDVETAFTELARRRAALGVRLGM